MHVLTATSETQGEVDGDFHWATDGEIVAMYGFVCHSWEGNCGCGRAYSGIVSHRATTTAQVTDVALTRAQVRQQIAECLTETGWLGLLDDPFEVEQAIDEVTDTMLEIADTFPEGAILTRHVLGSDNDPEPPQEEYIMRRIGATVSA